jgi:hypothetical protein
VRARVNQLLGGPGAAEIARQNLDAALAIRDDAPIHLLRARDALVSGALTSTLSEVRNALRLAPHWGDAAVAFAIVGSRAPDAGDRCEPLAGSHEPWAPDALRLCREGASPDPSLTAAAQRLSDTSRDPIRLALAASGGATGTLARVLAADRAELAAWLLLVGRPDLAEQALGTPDAGR